jgi:hypothetical protein
MFKANAGCVGILYFVGRLYFKNAARGLRFRY